MSPVPAMTSSVRCGHAGPPQRVRLPAVLPRPRSHRVGQRGRRAALHRTAATQAARASPADRRYCSPTNPPGAGLSLRGRRAQAATRAARRRHHDRGHHPRPHHRGRAAGARCTSSTAGSNPTRGPNRHERAYTSPRPASTTRHPTGGVLRAAYPTAAGGALRVGHRRRHRGDGCCGRHLGQQPRTDQPTAARTGHQSAHRHRGNSCSADRPSSPKTASTWSPESGR